MTCGEKITECRKKANLTQQELGDKLHVTAQAISKWENNLSEPDFATLRQLSQIFDISIDELINIDNNSNNTENEIEELDIKLDTDSISEKISTNVIEEVNKNITSQKETLGFCKQCGIAVNNSNLGRLTPSVLCSDCLNVKIKKEEEIKTQSKAKQLEDISKTRKKLIRGLILGTLFAILGIVAGIYIFSPNNGYTSGESIGLTIALVIFSFTFFGDLFTGIGLVHRIILKFATWSIKFPAIIFHFDLDGFIFLIVMKILFAIIGFLIGVLGLFVGLAIAAVVSIFHYPYLIIRLSLVISGKSKYSTIEDLFI